MSDEANKAKSRVPFALIVAIGILAFAIIAWFKGYVNFGSVKGLLAFIFILGAAVVIHEFGHFIVAKLLKIRVETFSVGFGPRLWGRKWGTTDYRVSAIPLGGYVKLGGDESNAPIEGEGATDIPPEEQFMLRPRWQKFLVAVAGPVMNILTALMIPLVGGLMYGVPITPAPVVKSIAPGSAAQTAGLQKGDRIISFNGNENPKWDTIRGDSMLSPEKPLPMIVERNGEKLQLTIAPDKSVENGEAIGVLGFQPDYGNVPIIITRIAANSPAEQAGLQAHDRIISIGGEPVTSSEQVIEYVRQHPTEPINLVIERQGQHKELTVTGRMADGKLGIYPAEEVPFESVGLIGTLRYSVDYNLEILRLTGKAIGQLFSGERSARNTFSGPIGIYDAASQAVNEAGWGGIFSMLGFLSLSLGIFNLLPIPVLDGGAIFLLLVEAILAVGGWKLSMRVRERIQQVGFVLLLLLMGFVITNDLLKKVSRNSDENKPQATATPK
ncbi:MAG TPA: RIP metalloprotease RseP [Pyrinomonadaceae bacterium]|nr:RIP metalloprotease RseP [Pyrinomonadaceae bacterium]